MRATGLPAKAKIFVPFIFFLICSIGLLSAQTTPSAKRLTPETMLVGAAPVWNQALGDLMVGQPFLQAQSAVIACAGGSVKSFFMTGTPLWDFDPQAEITPFIARSVEGASYVSDANGFFKGVNRIGRELWRVNLGKPIKFSPVVGWDGRVFIPVDSVISCRTASGNPLWTIDIGSPIATPPMLDHAGSFVAILENRDMVRVSQFSAVERIRLDRSPLIIISLKSENQDSYILFYPGGDAEKINYDETAAKGRKLSKGQFPRLPAPPASAASRGNLCAVTLRDGRVLLLNEMGQVLWTGNSHESAAEKGPANLDHTRAMMVYDDRGIYSLTTRGATGFAPDGRRRLILKMNESSSIPALSDEGLLYVCGMDKNLHTYKLDSKERTVPRSKYYGPQPEGNYGMGNPPPSSWYSDPGRFDNDIQNTVFDRMEQVINSGQIGENEPEFVAYLMEMIGFFLNDPHYSKVRPAVKPPRHIELIMLLGKVGSRDTIPFLYNIFDKYTEPSIKSACAEAIGKIGVDPYGNTFESYNFLLAANNPNRDPQLLMSATSSIAALCRFSGPPLSGEGIVLLRFFSNLSWAPNNVKTHIRQELDALYREGLDQIIR